MVLACAHVCVCGAESPSLYYVYYNLMTWPAVSGPVFDAVGSPLTGPQYRAELWGNGTDPSALVPAFYSEAYQQRGELVRVFAPFGTGDRAGYIRPGQENGLGVANPDVGDKCWLQVRAWDTTLGATYEEVAAKGIGGYGESPVFTARGGVPNAENPDLPWPLYGLQSFQLRPIVPEPGTGALLGFGLAGLGWFCRKW